MTIFLENRDHKSGDVGPGSTSLHAKHISRETASTAVHCTIPVKGGPITPAETMAGGGGGVRVSRFRKLTAVRFDANKNAAAIQRTAW